MKKELSKKEKATKIAKITLEVVFGVIVVLFFALFISSKVSSSPIFLFNKTTMWVMTNSMDPTIPPKTYILVEKTTASEVKVGDIIVFKSEDPLIYGRYNTHRVLEKNGNTFVTKGDNNPSTDGIYSAKAENIVGRYVKKLPVMTFLGRLVMTPVGFAVLIVLFLITMVICIVPDVKSAIKEKDKENDAEKQAEMRKRIDEEVRRLKEENGGEEKKTESINADKEESENAEKPKGE